MSEKSTLSNFLGGTLLVAGTAIGGGMLALPVLTGAAGFLPSIVLYLICWLFMVSTGLLYLEACLWSNQEKNILSLATLSLGKAGRYLAWVIYLFFFYCLTLAYIVGCGDLLSEFSSNTISATFGAWIFAAIAAPIIFCGWKAVAPLNAVMMIGLALSYLGFILLGYSYVQPKLLLHREWNLMFSALPVAFAAFGYQGVVPSLVHYMKRDVKRLRLAIIIGSFLPFIAYTLWNWLILGIVPDAELSSAALEGKNAVFSLKHILNSSYLYLLGQIFAFCALTTSLFGVTLGLTDFLAEGLHIEKNAKGRLFLTSLIFLPALLIATLHPGLFLEALTLAGGIGSVILLGLLPVMIVYAGRYRFGYQSSYHFFAGKKLLFLLGFFTLLELCSELFIIIN